MRGPSTSIKKPNYDMTIMFNEFDTVALSYYIIC